MGAATGKAGKEDWVTPIGAARRRFVTAETHRWIAVAEDIYGHALGRVPVLFDLRGRMAGMYRIRGEAREIRYNPWLFAKYPEDGIRVTVPHEVAHYVTDCLHGFRNIRPHGREWREVMAHFGVDPDEAIHHRLDLRGIPVRRVRRHPYRCACQHHQLSGIRHGRIRRGAARYMCRRCGAELEPVSAGSGEAGSGPALRAPRPAR